MIRNAQKELIDLINRLGSNGELPVIRCAAIMHQRDWDIKEVMALRENHTETELTEFMGTLDFEYDGGFGGQELYGMVWFTDGSYLEREEYDGSESWVHVGKAQPPIGLVSMNQEGLVVPGKSWIPGDVDDWLGELAGHNREGIPTHPTAADRANNKPKPLAIES